MTLPLSKWLRVLIAALFAAIVLFGVSPSTADGASSYRVLECQGNDSSRSAPDARLTASDGAISYGVNCPGPYAFTQGWGKGIVFHPASGGYYGPRRSSAELNAPPTTYFNAGSFVADVGGFWTACDINGPSCWRAGVSVGRADRVPISSYPMGWNQPATYVAAWPNCGASCTKIWMDSWCNSGALCTHNASPNDWYYDYVAMRQFDLILVDIEAPSLALSGSLFDGQIAHGTETVQIDATDRGSGVGTATVDVNGQRVGAPATDCPGMADNRTYARQFRPCGDLHTAAHLDTESTPWRDGANTLQVCVGDVNTGPGTGNTNCEQRTLSVDNSCPDSSGASGQAQAITAGLENPRTGQLQRTRSVRSSEGTALRGQLTGSNGPVKAASVCIYETVDEPAGIAQLVQVAKSSSTGKFGVEIPGGPNRIFQVAYRYGDHWLGTPSMYLNSSVLPTLRLTKSKLSNGQAVGFRGRIPGPDNNGRAITLQAKVGKKWRSFKQLQTDSSGRFKGKYRFTQTFGRALYVFRALVKRQGGYPYSPGASKKRKLLVHG
jgi:hypothetical protein